MQRSNKHDVKFVKDLMNNLKIKTVIADKGYDANYLRDSIINTVISCISRRKR